MRDTKHTCGGIVSVSRVGVFLWSFGWPLAGLSRFATKERHTPATAVASRRGRGTEWRVEKGCRRHGCLQHCFSVGRFGDARGHHLTCTARRELCLPRGPSSCRHHGQGKMLLHAASLPGRPHDNKVHDTLRRARNRRLRGAAIACKRMNREEHSRVMHNTIVEPLSHLLVPVLRHPAAGDGENAAQPQERQQMGAGSDAPSAALRGTRQRRQSGRCRGMCYNLSLNIHR